MRGQNLRDVWPHEAVGRALAGEELVGLSCRFTDARGRERTLSLSSAQVYNASGEGGDHRLGDSGSEREGGAGGRSPATRPLGFYGGHWPRAWPTKVRNPLNAISVIVQRLRREFTPRTDEDEYRQLTQVVAGEVERVNRIIQQFLEAGASTRTRKDARRADVDLRAGG